MFKHIVAECDTCKMVLRGTNLKKIGNKYYCGADYDKIMEEPENEFQNRRYNNYKRIFH